jgi:hypothetical protein
MGKKGGAVEGKGGDRGGTKCVLITKIKGYKSPILHVL